MVVSYQNHYNARLNKCFYLQTVNTYPKNKAENVHEDGVLFDINDNREYGNFHRMMNYEGPYDPVPVICNLLERQCHSRVEWEYLVRPYMEE